MDTIAIVSPGAMGAALGRGYVEGGARVVATVAGRSPRTRELAHGLELLPSLEAAIGEADAVISVVPPGQALGVAEQIGTVARTLGVRPLVVDLNAVSPTTMTRVSDALDGLDVVDGSISGGPPNEGTTVIYLSGPRAQDVAALSHPRLDARVVGNRIGAASAVKMSTASVYKGLSAILVQAVLSADVNGVLDTVLGDLTRQFPEVVADLPEWLASSASKSERYVAEMREIASTQQAAGLSPELFEGVAEVWARVAETRLGQANPEQARDYVDLLAVIRDLTCRPDPRRAAHPG
jgi:3-hydroxyisobutyrate dehydrogenase-like beta-hydroxyacid dehydrogenase